MSPLIWSLQAAFAVIMVLAGAAKIKNPDPTAGALLRLRLPAVRPLARPPLVRSIGAIEIIAGLAALAGGRLGGGVVLLGYLAFTAVAARLFSAAPDSSCGCFGEAGTAVRPVHLMVNLAGVVVGAVAVGIAPTTAALVAGHGSAELVTIGVLTAVLATLIYLFLTALPDLLAARQLLETT